MSRLAVLVFLLIAFVPGDHVAATVLWQHGTKNADLKDWGQVQCGVHTSPECPCTDPKAPRRLAPQQQTVSTCPGSQTFASVLRDPASRFHFVPDPRISGPPYRLTVVLEGTDNAPPHGHRNELALSQTTFGEGDERYIGWTTAFPAPPPGPPNPRSPGWIVFFQLHQVGNCFPPTLQLALRPSATGYRRHLILKTQYDDDYTNEKVLWSDTTDIVADQPTRYVLHVKFSAAATSGSIAFSMDDKPVLLKLGPPSAPAQLQLSTSTLMTWPGSPEWLWRCREDITFGPIAIFHRFGPLKWLSGPRPGGKGPMPVYLKLGLYADPKITSQLTVQHWCTAVATTYHDAASPPNC